MNAMGHKADTRKRRLLSAVFAVGLMVSCAGPRQVPSQPAEEKFRLAMTKFDRRHYEEARLLFESVIFESPGSLVADSAQYLTGMCYYRQKEYELAAAEFQRFFTQYSTSPLVDDAELMRARCYYLGAPGNTGLDLHYTETCVTLVHAFKDDHPQSELLPAADSLLSACWEQLSRKDFNAGKLYYRMGAYPAARVYFQLLLDQYPNSPLAPQAVYLTGESFYRRQMYDSAVVWYEKLVYLYPDASPTSKAKRRIAKLRPLLPVAPSAVQGEKP